MHLKIKRVNEFKEHGTILTAHNDNDTTNEVTARTQAGNKCYCGLTKLQNT